MSKKKKKQKKSKSSNVIPFKAKAPKAPKISLKERLNHVYTSQVSLDTTCAGNCACCKVAMPQMNYCEFVQLTKSIWEKEDKDGKVGLICKSIEYFFKNEFEKWGMDTLIKPCMLLGEDGRCRYYDDRPLSCRMYGLWPEAEYESRVDKFEKAYEGLLTRDELPLNKQCPFVERVDDSIALTPKLINFLYDELSYIDSMIADFSETQIENKENYRTFHDWLLLKVFGEDWLSRLTSFMMAADKDSIEDLMVQIKSQVSESLSANLPTYDDLKLVKDDNE